MLRYVSPEEMTLPARFISKTAHFVAVLTVIFDLRTTVSSMLMWSPDAAGFVTASQMYTPAQFDAELNRLSGVVYASMACFAIEYASLFLGVSIFMRGLNCLHTLLHTLGAILVSLFYMRAWPVDSMIAFFVLFSLIPAVLEILAFVFVTRFSIFKY